MTNDVIKYVCKTCKLDREKMFMGFYPDGRTKKYIDKEGREANGRQCSACNLERLRQLMRKKRGKV